MINVVSHRIGWPLVTSTFIALGLLAHEPVVAKQIRVGRYLTVNSSAQTAERTPLSQTFMLRFPGTIQTVGQAMGYLLSNTGYRLLPVKYQSTDVKDLFAQSLPMSDRKMGPMSVQQALLTLAGPAYLMLLDPKHSYVSFMLHRSLQNLYQVEK